MNACTVQQETNTIVVQFLGEVPSGADFLDMCINAGIAAGVDPEEIMEAARDAGNDEGPDKITITE